MDIPESIALQGVEVVNEYRKMQNEMSNLNDQHFNAASKLRGVEEQIRRFIDEGRLQGRRSVYYTQWKTRDIVQRSYTMTALMKTHSELSFRLADLDNRVASLQLELYYKGWLPARMMEAYKKNLEEDKNA